MTKLKILISIISSFLLISCNDSSYNYGEVKDNVQGIILKGHFIKDSLFHGLVKIFDSSGNYLGYSNYYYGIENGPHVLFSKNNVKTDSLNFKYGLENGYAYKYDSSGRLTFQVYYFRGLPSGSTCVYDESGNFLDYYFLDLDGDLIYSLTPINDSMLTEIGSPINLKVRSQNSGGINKNILMLYVLDIPFYKTHFEIAIVDRNDRIISSKKIITKDLFYQQELDSLVDDERYAIVFHRYNKAKGRDDLMIKIVE